MHPPSLRVKRQQMSQEKSSALQSTLESWVVFCQFVYSLLMFAFRLATIGSLMIFVYRCQHGCFQACHGLLCVTLSLGFIISWSRLFHAKTCRCASNAAQTKLDRRDTWITITLTHWITFGVFMLSQMQQLLVFCATYISGLTGRDATERPRGNLSAMAQRTHLTTEDEKRRSIRHIHERSGVSAQRQWFVHAVDGQNPAVIDTDISEKWH